MAPAHPAGMTDTTTAPASQLRERTIDRFLAGVASGAGVPDDLYAPDASVDAVVPGWRFGRRGAAAIAAEYRGWFADPGTVEEVRHQPTPDGAVLEYTVCWSEQGVPHAARHVHVLTIGDDGRITDDHVWCGGRWPAPLLAEIEAARHDG